MQKIVINKCYGGFSISEKALYRLAELKGVTLYKKQEDGEFFPTYWTVPEIPDGIIKDKDWHKASLEDRIISNELCRKSTMGNRPENRADPDLIKVVEELGKDADGKHSKLCVVEVPDGVEWEIEEYDGLEHVAEKHRIWG